MPTLHNPPVRRLNATLPEPLAEFVARMTGEGGLYETPSEFVRDLIRRQMERTLAEEQQTLGSLLRQSLAENSYTPLTEADAQAVRNSLQ
jgi:antitoxin ParD1/3/4